MDVLESVGQIWVWRFKDIGIVVGHWVRMCPNALWRFVSAPEAASLIHGVAVVGARGSRGRGAAFRHGPRMPPRGGRQRRTRTGAEKVATMAVATVTAIMLTRVVVMT